METLDIVCEGLRGPLGSRESNTEVVSEGKGKKVYLVCLLMGWRETCSGVLVQLNVS